MPAADHKVCELVPQHLVPRFSRSSIATTLLSKAGAESNSSALAATTHPNYEPEKAEGCAKGTSSTNSNTPSLYRLAAIG